MTPETPEPQEQDQYKRSPQAHRRSLLIGLTTPVFIGIAVLIGSFALQRLQQSHDAVHTPAPPTNVLDSTKVYFGIYTLNIGNIDYGSKTFDFDGYVWLRFRGDSSRGQLELMNARGGNMVDFNAIDNRILSDGSRYVAYHVKGMFLAKYNLRHFPFDAQILTFEVENPLYETKDYVFVPDSASFNRKSSYIGLEPGLNMVEYDIHSTRIYAADHAYLTDFGIPESGVGESHFSRAIFEINIIRRYGSYLIKFLLPLLIILGVTYIVFFIPPHQMEVNAGICITALLTAVALGISQSEPASSAGYFMTTDRFFVLSYAMILLTFVEAVIAGNGADHHRSWTEPLHGWSRDLFFPLYAVGLIVIALIEYFS